MPLQPVRLPNVTPAIPALRPRRARSIGIGLAILLVGALGSAAVIHFLSADVVPPSKEAAPIAATAPAPVMLAPPVADASREAPSAVDATPLDAGGHDARVSRSPSPPAREPATAPPPLDAAAAQDRPAGADDAVCDEVSCVMSHYDRPCCERYRPAETGFRPTAELPEQLDRSMVRAGIEKIKPRVIACGERTSVKGTVTLSITVAADGKVREVAVQVTPDVSLGECVAAAIRKAEFVTTAHSTTFTYPFAF